MTTQWSKKRRAAQVERMRKLHADPVFAKANVERMRKLNADPVFKKERAERMRKLNADPVFKKEHAERSRKRMRKLHTDPVFAKAHAERSRKRMHKLNADPEFKVAQSERMKKMNADPKFKAALIERAKKMQADPKFKAALIERTKKMNADPKFKAAQSERSKKAQVEHPEIRLNGYGHNAEVDGHSFPSKAQADVWTKLRELGGEPAHEDVLTPIWTPFGNTFPDTMLGVSVLGIPAGVPIEIKDGDGSYVWSAAQVWAVLNGEILYICREDLKDAGAHARIKSRAKRGSRRGRSMSEPTGS